MHYEAKLSIGQVFFEVPFEDIGETDFLPEMESQLLVRYIVE